MTLTLFSPIVYCYHSLYYVQTPLQVCQHGLLDGGPKLQALHMSISDTA